MQSATAAIKAYALTDKLHVVLFERVPTLMEPSMPRTAVEDNKRMSLRVRPEQKAALVRAAAIKQTDLTDFVLQPALREAAAIIEAADHVKLSERDSLRVLDMLENPPPANARLAAAAKAMPRP
jgi:uncharacterized protein (DUF1778 family)